MPLGQVELYYLIYLVPGFLIYAIVSRLLLINQKKQVFDTTLFSLFLSLIVNLVLMFFDYLGWMKIEILDQKFFIFLFIVIILLSGVSIIFIKYILPRLEKLIQTMDIVKQDNKNILETIFDEKITANKKMFKKKSIWITLCTNDDKLYSGHISKQGNFSRHNYGIYLKKVRRIDDETDNQINVFEGMLFLEKQIKWISIIKND